MIRWLYKWLIKVPIKLLLIWPLKLIFVWPFKLLFGRTGPEERKATVIEVWDGDTVDVEFEDGETDRVRLLGIDAPETDSDIEQPENYEMDKDDLKKWAKRAKGFATENLHGEDVRVVYDSESDRRGHHDRLLAYIYLDDENFNRTLVEEGYARLYDTEFSKRDDFISAEETAKENRAGIWSDRKKGFWQRLTS